jgi:CheY-like chemotaxis protein
MDVAASVGKSNGRTQVPATVLIVDDNEDDVLILQRIMRRHGLINPVRTFCRGDDAIGYLEGQGRFAARSLFPYPSILFLDLELPGKSGKEVLQWISSHSEIPKFEVIIYTDIAMFPELQKCYELGATGFLFKQEQEAQFKKFLHQFSDLWQFRYPDQQ